MSPKKPNSGIIILILILAMGLVLRIIGIDFGLPMAYHNDEKVMVYPAQHFFTGDFNPHKFLYPSFLMYIMHGAARLYFLFFSGREDLSLFYILCRTVVVLFAIATIYLTFRLGKKLHDERVGIMAALILCLSPLHVINSHFATTDVPLAFFVIMTLMMILRLLETGSWREYLLTGLFFGFTVSIKIPGAVLFIPILIAHLFYVKSTHQLTLGEIISNTRRKHVIVLISSICAAIAIYFIFAHAAFFVDKIVHLIRVELWMKYYDKIITRTVAMAPKMAILSALMIIALSFTSKLWLVDFKKLMVLFGVAIAAFFVTTPYAILDYKTFLHDFMFQMLVSQSSWGGIFAGKSPAYITNFIYLWQDFGAVLVCLILLALIIYIVRNRISYWIPILFVFIFYAYIGTWKLMFDRYMVPLLPLMAIMAAFALIWLIDFGAQRINHRVIRSVFLATIMIGFLVAPCARMLLNSYDFDRYLLKTNTKELAYNWALANITRDTRVLREQYAPELELAGYRVLNVNFTFNDSVDVEYIKRHGIEYIIVTDKLWNRPVSVDGVIGKRTNYLEIETYATLIYDIKTTPINPGPEIKIYQVKPEFVNSKAIGEPEPKNPLRYEDSVRSFF